MIALIILCSFILVVLGVISVFSILLYIRMTKLIMLNGAYQAEEYRNAVAVQKNKKPTLEPIKQKVRGRSIVKTDELVDLADLDWETGMKAIEGLNV